MRTRTDALFHQFINVI